jgi:FkbM family methyltransferase
MTMDRRTIHAILASRTARAIHQLAGTRYGARAARSADTVNRLLNNDSSNMHVNGEAWLLSQLSHVAQTVFDVGAYRGDWACEALARVHGVAVHAFEPIPETFAELSDRFGHDDRVRLNRLALSNTPNGDLRMWIDPRDRSLSSATAQPSPLARELLVPQTTGDSYAMEHGIDRIDILKIDAEGHEMEVLNGFHDSFERNSISLVQFEFTLWAAIARRWLIEYYEFFAQWDFRVGKLWPRAVRWKPYSPADEQFLHNNFIAVRLGSDAALVLGAD